VAREAADDGNGGGAIGAARRRQHQRRHALVAAREIRSDQIRLRVAASVGVLVAASDEGMPPLMPARVGRCLHLSIVYPQMEGRVAAWCWRA
jgi:hypothetical protein